MHLNVAVSPTTMNFNCYVVLVFLQSARSCIWWWIVGCLWWLVGCCCSKSNLSIKCRDSCSQSLNSVVASSQRARRRRKVDEKRRGKVKENSTAAATSSMRTCLLGNNTSCGFNIQPRTYSNPLRASSVHLAIQYAQVGMPKKQSRASSLADLIINLWFRQSQPDAGVQ